MTIEDRLAAIELRLSRLESERQPKTLLGVAGKRNRLDGLCTLTPDCIALADHTPPCWDGTPEEPGSRLPPHLREQWERMIR